LDLVVQLFHFLSLHIDLRLLQLDFGLILGGQLVNLAIELLGNICQCTLFILFKLFNIILILTDLIFKQGDLILEGLLQLLKLILLCDSCILTLLDQLLLSLLES
jgi:hypothetical protein